MCQYVSVDGGPTDWQFVHFGRYAMGGAGIVFGEETAVEARGNDHQATAYRRVTDFIKQMGAVPAIQLRHCGRNAGSHGAMDDWRALDERDARAGMPPWRGAVFRCRSRWTTTTSAACSRRSAMRRTVPPTPATTFAKSMARTAI